MTIQSQLDQVLAPCPGCGGERTRVIGGPGTAGGPKFWVGCDFCRWRTWGDTEADAIATWNHRAAVGGEAVGVVAEGFSDAMGGSVHIARWTDKQPAIGTKLYASPPATVDVGAGREALAIIDKWMESYDHMGTGTSAVARMSEQEWEEDRAKLAALIGEKA